MGGKHILWLALLSGVVFSLGPVSAQQEPADFPSAEEALVAQAPPPMVPGMPVPGGPGGPGAGGPWAGGRTMSLLAGGMGSLWMESRDPEILKLVTDIALLRQINRVDISADQIRRVLPILKGLVAKQKEARASVKEALLRQKRELLRQGPSPEEAGPPGSEWVGGARELRTEFETARGELGKILRPEQMQAFERLIQPRGPEMPVFRPGLSGPGIPGAPPAAPGIGPPGAATPVPPRPRTSRRDRTGGSAAGLGAGPQIPSSVILERVVELLEEKLAALTAK